MTDTTVDYRGGISDTRLMEVGHSSQLGSARLVTLGDGAERNVRVVEFRNTRGLDFGVVVDRGFDIGWCRWNGRSLAWHSPTGFVGPWYREPDGYGFLRSFGGGLFTTSGLDHILYPEEDTEVTYGRAAQAPTRYGLHGRISSTPAQLLGYGLANGTGGPTLYAKGRVSQAGALAEHLVLDRTITVGLDGSRITWSDTVTNEGWYPTPHMFLYHVNLGAPLLSEASELLAPIDNVLFKSETAADIPADGHLTFHRPRRGFAGQVFSHRMVPGVDGLVRVALINHDDRDHPWGAVLTYESERFPRFFQWRYLDAARYVTGLEPSTNGLFGRDAARRAGELRMLESNESVAYSTSLEVVDGLEEVDDIRRRIDTPR